jgi:hypothetical protein
MNERLKELAEQAGFQEYFLGNGYIVRDQELERFAELVRQDYLEEMNGHTLKMVMLAIAREREACAQLCDDEGRVVPVTQNEILNKQCYRLADLIRARGNHEQD